MNLISDCWIPVRRADGSHQRIAPWQLTDNLGDNPIQAVASPRPDFDGALTQFLIGLLQTTCTPTEDQWWDWRETPPSPDVLKKRLEVLSPAFQLDGNGSALFMQEQLGDKAEKHPVTYLLIGAATDSTLKHNTDHFQKRPHENECLCRACAASALYTLQTFAPSGGGGGDGKFTSLRGGGPLTTLVLGSHLWETVWLNVIYGDTFPNSSFGCTTFVWLNTRSFITESKPVKTIYSSSSMQPEHVFWGMPRRIQLHFKDNNKVPGEASICTACGQTDELICTEFHDLTGGLTYQEEYTELNKKGEVKKKKRPSWVSPNHPLSPHTTSKEDFPIAVHPQPGGIGYRHWLGLVENSVEGDTKRRPARVVEQFRNTGEDAKLWAFGFDMDNMKARCWYDATMPILAIPREQKALFSDGATRMVKGAQKVEEDLRKYLKASLFPEKNKVKANDLRFARDFWDMTEVAFYEHLRQLHATLPVDSSAHSVLKGWLKVLRKAALAVFDRYSQTGDFDTVSPRRVALARNKLGKALVSTPLREKILGLPKLPKPTHKRS